MPQFEVWDVVLVPAFPNQENSKEVTTRPAIIIEDLQNEVLICPVTTQLHQQSNYKYSFIVDKDSAEAKEMGLTFTSLVVVDRLVELRKVRLSQAIGSCPQSIIDRIESLIEKMNEDKGLN